MITRREILATINATTRETGYELEALATLALMCYLVHESDQHPDAVNDLPVAICWGS